MPKKNRVVFSIGPQGPGQGSKKFCPNCRSNPCACEPKVSYPIDTQSPRVRRERSGRKGKTVTVIEPLRLNRADATELLAGLKKSCGSGGALKTGCAQDGSPCFILELQGDHAEKVTAALTERGYRAKRAGG
jgi:translation initiation factor 1